MSSHVHHPSLPGYDPHQVWVDVQGYEGRYQVNALGQVRCLSSYRRWKPGRLVTGAAMKRGGYLRLRLRSDDGSVRSRLIHDLVLEAFVGPAPAGHQARHLNGVPTDNALANLCWGTAKENAADRERHGRTARGERGGRSKLSDAERTQIRALVAEGHTRAEVARRFSISWTTVWDLMGRKKEVVQ